MGRFVLIGSSTLFWALSETGEGRIGWPLLGYLFLIVDFLRGKKDPRSKFLSIGLSTQVMAWTFTGQWVQAAILLALDLLHGKSMEENYIKIDPAGLTFSFPWKRTYPWSAIQHIILKDGILTLEYGNGRVLQQAIQKDSEWTEANFNEFCQQQCNP